MTEKEKANNIYNQMLEWVDDAHVYKERNIISTTAKQCALICVDEMLEELGEELKLAYNYWQEVKQEINKL